MMYRNGMNNLQLPTINFQENMYKTYKQAHRYNIEATHFYPYKPDYP